jgi:hypothetical protein
MPSKTWPVPLMSSRRVAILAEMTSIIASLGFINSFIEGRKFGGVVPLKSRSTLRMTAARVIT